MPRLRWIALVAAVAGLQSVLSALPLRLTDHSESRIIAGLQLLAAAAPRAAALESTADVHQLLLAPKEIARAELERRLCSDRLKTSDGGHPQSGLDEPHSAQTLLALYAVSFGSLAGVSPVCDVPVSILIEREVGKASYENAARFLRLSLKPLLVHEGAKLPPRGTPEYTDWLLSPSRRALRQQLTALDLSWYAQLTTLTLVRTPAQVDNHRRYSAVQSVVDAQLQYLSAGNVGSSFNFVTEYGVHTLGMLMVAIEVLEKHPELDSRHLTIAYTKNARALFIELAHEALSEAVNTRNDTAHRLLRAHLVQLALCGRGLLSDSGARYLEDGRALLQRIAVQLLRDVEGRVEESAVWLFHAREALLRMLRHVSQVPSEPGLGDCLCI